MVAAGLEQHGAQKIQARGIEGKPIGLGHTLGPKPPLQIALDLESVIHPNGVDLGGLLTHLQLLGTAHPIFGDADFVQPIGVGAHHEDDSLHEPPSASTRLKSRFNKANRPSARAMPERCDEQVKLSVSPLSSKSELARELEPPTHLLLPTAAPRTVQGSNPSNSQTNQRGSSDTKGCPRTQ